MTLEGWRTRVPWTAEAWSQRLAKRTQSRLLKSERAKIALVQLNRLCCCRSRKVDPPYLLSFRSIYWQRRDNFIATAVAGAELTKQGIKRRRLAGNVVQCDDMGMGSDVAQGALQRQPPRHTAMNELSRKLYEKFLQSGNRPRKIDAAAPVHVAVGQVREAAVSGSEGVGGRVGIGNRTLKDGFEIELVGSRRLSWQPHLSL